MHCSLIDSTHPISLNDFAFCDDVDFHAYVLFYLFFLCYFQTIDKLPDKVLLNIFSYLSHREICRMARVCRRWRAMAYNTQLWKNVSLRPEVSGLHVGSLDMLLSLVSIRFGASLRYIELPIELITHTVLHELAAKCPNLTHMLLDFSTAMQLHDFSEMQAFPTKLRYMCICLSEVIFMEGFMRKIYNFINGLEVKIFISYSLKSPYTFHTEKLHIYHFLLVLPLFPLNTYNNTQIMRAGAAFDWNVWKSGRGRRRNLRSYQRSQT